MLREPTLVFSADLAGQNDRRYAGDVSFCCGAHTDSDDRCADCELISSAPAPYTCSECHAQVANLTPNADMLLECAFCGARWGDLGGEEGTALYNGIPANAWNPAKAPVRYTQYLTSFFGFKPDAPTTDEFPVQLRCPVTAAENARIDDGWDGVS